MYWLNKLKEFKKESKETYKSISQKTGIALTTIEKLFSGRTKEPKLLMMDCIVRVLGHSLNELVQHSEESFKITSDELNFVYRLRNIDALGLERVQSALNSEEERIKALCSVKTAQVYHKIYFDFPVSAGTGEFLDNSTATVAELSDKPPSNTHYILRISGNSMEPEFCNGDFVYVSRDTMLTYGDIGIFVISGSVYIKQYTADGLLSFNSDYPLIKGSNDINCLGKVLGKVQGSIIIK